jgi:Flp pilus assembly protein TadD
VQINPNSRPNSPQAASQTQSSLTTGVTPSARDRAERHYLRALEQVKMRNSTSAVQELRGAIENNPYKSEYHALLGKVHLEKGLTGMANINIRQALKLNPEEPLALDCLKKIKVQTVNQEQESAQGITNRVMNFLNGKI